LRTMACQAGRFHRDTGEVAGAHLRTDARWWPNSLIVMWRCGHLMQSGNAFTIPATSHEVEIPIDVGQECPFVIDD
jgi:hypothetical protein